LPNPAGLASDSVKESLEDDLLANVSDVARRGKDEPWRKQQRVGQAAAYAERFDTGTKASQQQSGCASVNAANGSQDLHS